MTSHKLIAVSLDAGTMARWSAELEHERRVAIYDLLEDNHFVLEKGDAKNGQERHNGPYKLHLETYDGRLVFHIRDALGDGLYTFQLALSPLRRVIRDYFAVCDAYHDAIRTKSPTQIEAIDMGRRSLHDEGSRLLAERLNGKVAMDDKTARRLFTLVCTLHMKAGRSLGQGFEQGGAHG